MRLSILVRPFFGAVLAASLGASEAQAKGSVAQIAAVQGELGFRLLTDLAGSEPSPPTVLVSPASVSAALAFLDLAADERMHAALTKVLGFGEVTAETPLEVLRTSARDLAAGEPDKAPLAFADAVVVDPGAKVKPQGLDLFKAAGMEAFEAELGEASGVAMVNAWVAKKTGGLIPDILPGPLTRPMLVLLNAFHFKDAWSEPFNKVWTQPQPFHLVGGQSATVDMMNGAATFGVREDDRFIGVMLPYESPDFRLTVITTKTDPAKLADFAPVVAWLDGSDFREAGKVVLSLPRFTASLSADLLPSMKQLGLAAGYSKTAFMSLSDDPVEISAILQKALFTVDETGTEAAAATAIVPVPGAAAEPEESPREIRVDKPFVFALVDSRHGFVLMFGYIGNPATK